MYRTAFALVPSPWRCKFYNAPFKGPVAGTLRSGPPLWWLDKRKLATNGLAYGLVRVVRDVSDPRELSAYQADALSFGRDGHPTELEAMLAEGWTIADPAALDKLGLRLDEDGRLERVSS